MVELWLFFLSCFWGPLKRFKFWILDFKVCLKKLGIGPGMYGKSVLYLQCTMVQNPPTNLYKSKIMYSIVKPYWNDFSYLPCWLNNHNSRPWFQWWKPVVLFLELIAEFGHKFRWFRWELYRLMIFKKSHCLPFYQRI